MRHKWIALLLALVCLLGGCRGEEPEDIPAPPYCTFVDDAGQEIILQEQPQNVAVLFSSYAWQFLLSLCRILTNTITINPINTVTRPATMEMPYRFAPTISL